MTENDLLAPAIAIGNHLHKMHMFTVYHNDMY